jgi:hypothetical protein
MIRGAAVTAAVAFLALAGPALADDGGGEAVTVARLCYVVDGSTKALQPREVPGARVVHPSRLLERHAVCVDPPDQARPSIGLERLARRFPGALERPRPDLPVAIVQCGGDGATVTSQPGDSLSLSESDFTRHDALSSVVDSCASALGASLGRDDDVLGGLVGHGSHLGLGGPWTPGGSSECGGGPGPDPRLAEDGATGGITVDLDEDGIDIDTSGGITVDLDEDGIEIDTAGGITVDLDEEGIVITPSGSSERPVDDSPESACQVMQELAWECEQTGWKRGDCQALDLLMRCGIDVTIINPTDDGFACPKDATSSDAGADAGASVLLHACGAEIAHPLPDRDFCGSGAGLGGPVLSGSGGVPGGCDGTIAETDGMGCPVAAPTTTTGTGGGTVPPGPTGPGPELVGTH